VLKIAAAESPANKEQLAQWVGKWQPQVLQALQPVAAAAFGTQAGTELDACAGQLAERLAKSGL
jgi:phenol hydroxylase P1 protein